MRVGGITQEDCVGWGDPPYLEGKVALVVTEEGSGHGRNPQGEVWEIMEGAGSRVG
jgi:hypothetical protein